MDQQPDHGERKTKQDDGLTARLPVETDPRFPSGRWKGYVLIPPQRSPHSMVLQLRFGNGAVTGTGRDIPGDFTVVGTYNKDGSCAFEKQYLNGQVTHFAGHHVNQGRYVGISGDWVLDDRWHERFWIEYVTEQKRL